MAGVSEITKKNCSVAKNVVFQSFSRWKQVRFCRKQSGNQGYKPRQEPGPGFPETLKRWTDLHGSGHLNTWSMNLQTNLFFNVLGIRTMMFFFKYLLLYYYNAYNARVTVTFKARWIIDSEGMRLWRAIVYLYSTLLYCKLYCIHMHNWLVPGGEDLQKLLKFSLSYLDSLVQAAGFSHAVVNRDKLLPWACPELRVWWMFRLTLRSLCGRIAAGNWAPVILGGCSSLYVFENVPSLQRYKQLFQVDPASIISSWHWQVIIFWNRNYNEEKWCFVLKKKKKVLVILNY